MTRPPPTPPPPWSVSITGAIVLHADTVSPADGDIEVPLNKSVTVDFNRDVNSRTLTASTFKISRLRTFGYLTATLSYNSLTRRATLNPSADLLPGATYEVTITEGIESTGGLPLINPKTWEFKTISSPKVLSRTPTPGDDGVPVNQTISITFDKDMDLGSIGAASFYLRDSDDDPVPATLALSVSKRTATLNPLADLEEGETYTVTLTNAVEGENGLSVEGAPIVWAFTTGADAPQVTAKTPAHGATNVPLGVVVSVTFNQDMDESTITSATFYIKKSGGSPLPATVSYDVATRTATLDPLADLEGGLIYEVTVTTAVENENGTPLASAVIWTFTTSGEAPQVTTKVPAGGATNVPVGQVVSATFDQDMDASTITSATFYIKKSGGSPLPATVAYSAATDTATLTPLTTLESGAGYEVTLSAAVESATGQTLAGAPVVWSFNTAGGTSIFSDVIPGVTPYSAAIAQLASDGVITGFPDGTFRPNDMVLRQQFAKMIVLTLHLPITGTEVCPFTDVAPQIGYDPFYPSKYVAVCAAHGIAQGITPTIFDPYNHITHQQLVTMIARAANLSDPPAAYTPPFTAAQFSPNEHYLNARKAAYAGLLDGLLGVGPSYNFFAGSTRGECAQLLYNLMMAE